MWFFATTIQLLRCALLTFNETDLLLPSTSLSSEHPCQTAVDAYEATLSFPSTTEPVEAVTLVCR